MKAKDKRGIRLDHSKLLGFDQVAKARDDRTLTARTGSKVGTKRSAFGARVGVKIGAKPGTKTARG